MDVLQKRVKQEKGCVCFSVIQYYFPDKPFPLLVYEFYAERFLFSHRSLLVLFYHLAVNLLTCFFLFYTKNLFLHFFTCFNSISSFKTSSTVFNTDSKISSKFSVSKRKLSKNVSSIIISSITLQCRQSKIS